MHIPQYWARDQGTDVDPSGRQFQLTMWGWSSTSVAEAADLARERLQQALAKVRRGERLGGGYYPRLPLREETLQSLEHGGDVVAVVTRNRYGAEVLNTDRLFIADVDRDLQPRAAGVDIVREVGKRLGKLFGAKVPLAGAPEPTSALSPEELAVSEVQQWAARYPGFGVRVYRTFAGLRVIVSGADAAPSSELARRLLVELGSDPLYVQLCQQHDTYRARLTPKPWRVGWRALTVRWPYASGGGQREFARWLAGYERASHDRSTCRLVATAGPQAAAGTPEARVIELHDSVSRAEDGTPLA